MADRDPVVLLDGVDLKMTADMRSDPAAALLGVLDPAQNPAGGPLSRRCLTTYPKSSSSP